MQSSGRNINNDQDSKNSVPRMQSTAVKNLNSNNKNIKQSSMMSSEKSNFITNIHEEDWKMTPSGIKYKENYTGGFKANYSGADPMNEGYKTSNRDSTAQNAAAVSLLYNFGYTMLLIASVIFIFAGGALKTSIIPLIIIFTLILALKRLLLGKGCLVNLVIYIFITVLLFAAFKV